MAVTRFTVTIDRLRLNGVAREDAPALVAGMQRELERSLTRAANQSRPWSSVTLAELRPPTVQATGGPPGTGRALGRALATELAR
jgi:hypothetical protein